MGLNIADAYIIKNGAGGITLNQLVFNANGVGTANPAPGYAGWKAGGSTYYSGAAGWEINTANWLSGLNAGNGVFTCPTAGIYAMGYNGIHRGGSNIPAGLNTYGYAGFAKNGVLNYFVHWNMSASHSWNTGGVSVLFQCAFGDTLTLHINRPPVSNGPDCISQNYGLYPDAHSAIWCKLVG